MKWVRLAPLPANLDRLSVFALAHGSFGLAPGIEGLASSHRRLGVGPSGGVRLRLFPGAINGRMVPNALEAQALAYAYF